MTSSSASSTKRGIARRMLRSVPAALLGLAASWLFATTTSASVLIPTVTGPITGPGQPFLASTNFDVEQLLRGSSNFDIRHNLQLSATYDLPRLARSGWAAAVVNGFGLDLRLSARSALPVDLVGLRAIDPDSGTAFPFAPQAVPPLRLPSD